MEKTSQVRVHVKVTGLVQGVGYRIATWQQATRLGLAGWVRNLSDGRVEAVFEGPLAQVESMVQWCHKGPAAARVSRVDVDFEPPQALQEFAIIHN